MATSTLVTISKEMRESGWQLYKLFQANDFPIDGLFWAVFDDAEWRLFVVTPLSEEKGPIFVYDHLQTLLPDFLTPESEDAFLYDNIKVVGRNARIVKGVRDWARGRFGHEDGSVEGDARVIRRVSLSQNEAYVYYLAPEK